MNKSVFSTVSKAQPADTTNAAGGKAYSQDPYETLATLAAVGTFGDGAHTDAPTQVQQVVKLATTYGMPPEFVAKCAVYAPRCRLFFFLHRNAR